MRLATLDELLLALAPIDVDVTGRILARNFGPSLVAESERVGCMCHYDASTSDGGAVQWFQDPAWKYSYWRAYTDSGRRVLIAKHSRVWCYHAGGQGLCRTDARVRGCNRAFYSFTVTAGPTDKTGRVNPMNAETHAVVTMPQFTAAAYDIAVTAMWHRDRLGDARWGTEHIDYWLTGHKDWAIPPGRKQDPAGPPDWVERVGYEVWPIASLRFAVATILDTAQHDLTLRVRELLRAT